MIKKYSNKAEGNQQLGKNFKVREFACKDGSDTVYIDSELVKILQQIRNWAGASVSIHSGYRTTAYNAKIGGAFESYHTKGQAADISISGKTPSAAAKFAQAIGAGGVGLYDGTAGHFIHVDTRPVKYLWTNTSGRDNTASTHGGKCPYQPPSGLLQNGSGGEGVKWLQWWLGLWGFKLDCDGRFGAATEAAVRSLQTKLGLTVDGVVGAKTRDGLKGAV